MYILLLYILSKFYRPIEKFRIIKALFEKFNNKRKTENQLTPPEAPKTIIEDNYNFISILEKCVVCLVL